MDSKNILKREPSMDIIRCCALFLVVCVHFFWNSGFYGQIVSGWKMYIMVLIRSFSMICVPLFLLLTGYLTSNKKISRKYYIKLGSTLIIYLIASIVCVAYKLYHLEAVITFGDFIKGFFAFTNAPYAWYVEMYIGLFLLCPFLNILYHGIDTKKKKQILIITFLLLTAVPTVTNIMKFDIAWIFDPASASDYFPFFPDYWLALYPIGYYFIGCYLREYRIRIKSRYIFILMTAVFIANGTFAFYRSYGAVFNWGLWSQHNGFGQVIQTVLFFLFFENLSYRKTSPVIASFFGHVSKLCFCGYLVSWIFDDYFYTVLKSVIPEMEGRFPYLFIIVPLVYTSSLILSLIINTIHNTYIFILDKTVTVIKNRIGSHKKAVTSG